jgi:TonB family protein
VRARHLLIFCLFFSCCFVTRTNAQSRSSSPGGTTAPRKVVQKALPFYPDIAKRMNLVGTVRVMATVAPDGTVKSVQALGGSPVLLKAAQDAVYKWKYAPASGESSELIELHFDPN